MPTVHISSSLKENVEILSYDGFGTFYQNRISYQDADAKVLLDFNQELILHRFCRGYNLIFHFQVINLINFNYNSVHTHSCKGLNT